MKLEAGKYYLPGDMTRGQVDVEVDEVEFNELVRRGAKWEQLEHYYQVSKTILLMHFEGLYNKSQAELQIELIAAMRNVAIADRNPQMLKWLSQNWLGMSDQSRVVVQTEQLSPEEVDRQLKVLLRK